MTRSQPVFRGEALAHAPRPFQTVRRRICHTRTTWRVDPFSPCTWSIACAGEVRCTGFEKRCAELFETTAFVRCACGAEPCSGPGVAERGRTSPLSTNEYVHSVTMMEEPGAVEVAFAGQMAVPAPCGVRCVHWPPMFANTKRRGRRAEPKLRGRDRWRQMAQ
jgi:hypothetical protein